MSPLFGSHRASNTPAVSSKCHLCPNSSSFTVWTRVNICYRFHTWFLHNSRTWYPPPFHRLASVCTAKSVMYTVHEDYSIQITIWPDNKRHPLPRTRVMLRYADLLSTAVPAMVRDIKMMRLIIRHLPPNQQLVCLFYAEPVEYAGACNGEGHHDDEVNHTPPFPTQPTNK